MAIAPTGAIFNSLTFGSVNSANYGIYITGEAVYNAPERAVEMVDIPGRNGAIALDQGRWENIEVTYPCGCFGERQSDFRDAISNFRNAIVSQLGYQRLADTYNPSEYRMAVYMSGIEVSAKNMGEAGEFAITFNCKPQRWLTSGETAVTIANSGDTITNPTQYESSPLLAIKGYGNINLEGYPIEVNNEPLGNVTLLKNATKQAVSSYSSPIIITGTFSTASLNTGDTETLSGIVVTIPVDAGAGNKITAVSLTSPQSGTFKFNMTYTGLGTRYLNIVLRPNANTTMSAGTAVAENTSVHRINYTQVDSGGTGYSSFFDITFKYKKTVSGTDETLTVRVEPNTGSRTMALSRGTVTGYSTVSLLGDPTYIDMDIGEAYKIEDDEIIPLNSRIYIGGDLATLKSGANTITYDNTVTELKITPRWWKL